MAGIQIRNLSKIYRGSKEPIFDDFNVDFKDGEFIVILGPSGCGKSTLLRTIAGLEDIQGGQIILDGRNIANDDPKDRDMAMVFQNYALYPHMTVAGNLEFGMKMRGVDKKTRKARVLEAAKVVGLGDFLDRKPRNLSGGQRQRVALSRAMINNPKLFLMDEPLSNLDAKLRVNMRSEIINLYHNLGRTVIYVTHDQVEAMTMASHILLLNQGQIQQYDTPEALYHTPANIFTAQFIGSPQINIFKYPVENGMIRVGSSELVVPAGYSGSEIYLGVRPEAVSFIADADGEFVYHHSENLGNEYLLYFDRGEETWVGRSDHDFEPGNYQITLNINKLHWFDTETELRVSAEA